MSYDMSTRGEMVAEYLDLAWCKSTEAEKRALAIAGKHLAIRIDKQRGHASGIGAGMAREILGKLGLWLAEQERPE